MKNIKLKIKIGTLLLLLVFSIVFMKFQVTHAQEDLESKVIAEYLEKKSQGIEIYELTDEEGNFAGYFEPYSETNPAPSRRYTSTINWSISSNSYNYGDNQYILSVGSEISVNITQSSTGKSYLGVYDRRTSTWYKTSTSETTNGWNGIIVTTRESLYSFGIQNSSSMTIIYTGSYTL